MQQRAVLPVSAQMSRKSSGEDGSSETAGRGIVSVSIIIKDILDLYQAAGYGLTSRASQVGNVTNGSGAALGLGVDQNLPASVVGGAAATTTAAAATAATASGGNSNGERGHDGDDESRNLHSDGGRKTQRLNGSGVSVWLKTEDC